MSSTFGPAGAWELVLQARRPWIYLVRSLYAAALLSVLATGWPERSLGTAELAAVGSGLSFGLLLLHLFVVYCCTPLLVVDALLETKRPGRLELILMSPLTAREIVRSTLAARLLGVATLSMGIFPALALVGLLGGVDYHRLLLAALLTPPTLIYAGSLALHCSSSSGSYGLALRRCFIRLFLFTLIPGASPFLLWLMTLVGLTDVNCCLVGGFVLIFPMSIALNWLKTAEVNLSGVRTATHRDGSPDSFLRREDRLDPLEWGLVRMFGPFLIVAFLPGVLLLSLVGISTSDLIGVRFFLTLGNVIAALALAGAFALSLRGACHNPWLERCQGQGDLLLATTIGRWEVFRRLVVGRRPMQIGLTGIAVGAAALALTPVHSLAAGGIWLAFLLHLVALGTSLLVLGEPSRRAAAWTFVAAGFECALPMLALGRSSTLWLPSACIALVLLFFGRRSAVAVVLLHVSLFFTIAGIAASVIQPASPFAGDSASRLSPLYWEVRTFGDRMDDRPGLSDRSGAGALGYLLGASVACAVSWLWLGLRFGWLADRPRRNRAFALTGRLFRNRRNRA